jgi:hypothetical protein
MAAHLASRYLGGVKYRISATNEAMGTLSTILVLFAIVTGPGLFAASAAAAAPESPVPIWGSPFALTQPFIVTAPRITSRDLQLKVTATNNVQPLRYPADEALASRFQAEFKRKGFAGNVDFLSAADTPIPTLPLLEINLVDWRAIPGDLPDCEFSATLVTPKGTTWLGDFAGVSKTLFGTPTTKARIDTLRAAATNAIDDVYQDLKARHVLAGAGR